MPLTQLRVSVLYTFLELEELIKGIDESHFLVAWVGFVKCKLLLLALQKIDHNFYSPFCMIVHYGAHKSFLREFFNYLHYRIASGSYYCGSASYPLILVYRNSTAGLISLSRPSCGFFIR